MTYSLLLGTIAAQAASDEGWLWWGTKKVALVGGSLYVGARFGQSLERASKQRRIIAENEYERRNSGTVMAAGKLRAVITATEETLKNEEKGYELLASASAAASGSRPFSLVTMYEQNALVMPSLENGAGADEEDGGARRRDASPVKRRTTRERATGRPRTGTRHGSRSVHQED